MPTPLACAGRRVARVVAPGRPRRRAVVGRRTPGRWAGRHGRSLAAARRDRAVALLDARARARHRAPPPLLAFPGGRRCPHGRGDDQQEIAHHRRDAPGGLVGSESRMPPWRAPRHLRDAPTAPARAAQDTTGTRRLRKWRNPRVLATATGYGILCTGARGARISPSGVVSCRDLSCPRRSRSGLWSVAPASERPMFSRLARLQRGSPGDSGSCGLTTRGGSSPPFRIFQALKSLKFLAAVRVMFVPGTARGAKMGLSCPNVVSSHRVISS
jgi:hypothetical protein